MSGVAKMVKGKRFSARSHFPDGRLDRGVKRVAKDRSVARLLHIFKFFLRPRHIFRGRRWGAAWAGKWSQGGMPDFRAKKACSGLEKKIESVCFFAREQTIGPKMAFLDLNVWAKKRGKHAMR